MTFLNNRYSLYVGIISGTAAGLLIKYILDKKYIFFYSIVNIREDMGREERSRGDGEII